LQITNNGSGAALALAANTTPLKIANKGVPSGFTSGEALFVTIEGAESPFASFPGASTVNVITSGVLVDDPPIGIAVISTGTGVLAASITDNGVEGSSQSGYGVFGNTLGVPGGFSPFCAGVIGRCNPFTDVISYGVFGSSDKFTGVQGVTKTGIGVVGTALEEGTGVQGTADTGAGVQGESSGGFVSAGVVGTSRGGFISAGVMALNSADTNGIGLYARGSGGGVAGLFDGNVEVTGSLTKAGGGFKIDHPIDQTNKFLSHSFVEAPERKNVYDGVAALDDNGACWVELPEWFEALNGDFRYQLTAIGAPAPNLHVAREISNNRFNIAGGMSEMKVSWQVTGIRKDAWAQAHPLMAEEEKPESERGYYQHPELFNQPREKSVFWKGNAELVRQTEKPRLPDMDKLREQVRHLHDLTEKRRTVIK
jgi:hypothetical protein